MNEQAAAFAITLACEAPAGAALTVLAMSSSRSKARAALLGAVAAVVGSCVTHPLLWWANEAWAKTGNGWAWKIALLETAAALVESAAYVVVGELGVRRALAVSFAVNAWSFGAGLALYALHIL